jgi:hypothetical protein
MKIMENKKQTAVEWLVEQLPLGIRMNLAENGIDLHQAKAMEKEQIMEAANTLLYRGTGPGDMWAEQYYNDTYGE